MRSRAVIVIYDRGYWKTIYGRGQDGLLDKVQIEQVLGGWQLSVFVTIGIGIRKLNPTNYRYSQIVENHYLVQHYGRGWGEQAGAELQKNTVSTSILMTNKKNMPLWAVTMDDSAPTCKRKKLINPYKNVLPLWQKYARRQKKMIKIWEQKNEYRRKSKDINLSKRG